MNYNQLLKSPYLIYAGLSLLILGPLLLPGYILTLDMSFTPQLRLPTQVGNGYVFLALLHWLNLIVPADWLQKLLLSGIFWLAGVGMYCLADQLLGAFVQQPGQDEVPNRLTHYYRLTGLHTAGLFYVANPFTYGRLMAGQYGVLFGYALLPWFMRSLLYFLQAPRWRQAGKVTAWALLVSIVSIHSLGPLAIIGLLGLGLYIWRKYRERHYLKRIVLMVPAMVGIWLVASSYWLWPLVRGTNSVGAFVYSFDSGDRQAFATTGASAVEKVGNVLGLQGFWAERYDLFIQPQQTTPGWALLIFSLLVIVVIGAVAYYHKAKGMALLLCSCVILGALLAAGIGSEWFAQQLPLLGGFREPQKFAMLIAMAYGPLLAVGVITILNKLDNVLLRQKRQNTIGVSHRRLTVVLVAMAGALLLLLPLATTRIIFWAANGQLRSVSYPSGWQAVNDRLNEDSEQFQVVCLPWHLYTNLDFVGRVVANPAAKYFDKPVTISDDVGFTGAAPDRPTAISRQIGQALKTAPLSTHALGDSLAKLNIKYVILLKETDFQDYDYLDRQTNMVNLSNYEDISLYRNLSFQEKIN